MWMFRSQKMNQKTNILGREWFMRIVLTYFEDLLIKDESVSTPYSNIQKVATVMFKVKSNICPEYV